MNKILMSTVISKMFLSEQMKPSLGEDGAGEPLVEMFKSGNLEAPCVISLALYKTQNF